MTILDEFFIGNYAWYAKESVVQPFSHSTLDLWALKYLLVVCIVAVAVAVPVTVETMMVSD